MHKVLIRPLEEKDAYISYKWRNDPEIWKFTGNKPDKVITQEIELNWIKNVLRESNSFRFAICVDDKYIGNIQITNVIEKKSGEYHVFIGEKSYWGKGIATLATFQLIRFAKNGLNLKELFLYVKPENKVAIRVYEKCSFRKENDEIKMICDLSQSFKPTVSVFMMTYNHEKYIKQALESILMQKTNFDYELVIGEDCSTDNTRKIINEYSDKYPGKFKLLLHEKNIGAIANQIAVLKACTGKYIAICEGDDYWTDPYKLQKQVDFLEANPDFGMVHTNENIVDSSNKVIFASDTNKPSGDVFYDLLKSAFIVTCSTCFRRDIIHEILDYAKINNVKCAFDYWLWLHIAMRTKIHYMPEITSAYRSHSGGVSKGVGGFFKEIVPLAVLDAVSCKLTYFPERNLNKKWELYINYCRALTASALSWHDRKIYFKLLLNKPIFFFAFFPALWRKIKLRFSKKKS